jgi:hypothetical protein
LATQRQKKAIANLVKTGGIVSKAMIEAGYSPASANNPKVLTESIAFKTYADSIPDELLREKHLALLNKLDPTGDIDANAVKAGLDMGYKIKGTYAPERKDLKIEMPHPIYGGQSTDI